MKRLIFSIVLIFIVLSCVACRTETQTDVTVDTQIGEGIFSSFVTTDINNNVVSQKLFEDHKVTMINIWGTFCGPCIKEMPELAQLNVEYADKGFQVIGIPIDVTDRNNNKIADKITEMNEIIASTGADYTHLLPSKTLNDAYLSTVQAVPVSIFVNKDGYVIGSVYMGAKEKAEWETIINAMLGSIE